MPNWFDNLWQTRAAREARERARQRELERQEETQRRISEQVAPLLAQADECLAATEAEQRGVSDFVELNWEIYRAPTLHLEDYRVYLIGPQTNQLPTDAYFWEDGDTGKYVPKVKKIKRNLPDWF